MIVPFKLGERRMNRVRDTKWIFYALGFWYSSRAYTRAWLTYRLHGANFSIAADRSRNVNKTMHDDAIPMRSAYDAPRASMSPIAIGKGIMGGGVMGGGRRRYNIRNSWFIDLAIPSHTSGHFYTAIHVFVFGILLARYSKRTIAEFVSTFCYVMIFKHFTP